MPREACLASCHLPDLISFPQFLSSSKCRNQKLFCLIGLSQHESWHSLTQISSKRNNNNIKFPPITMALVLFGWVVTPPVSCHQRTTNLQVYTVFLGMFFLFSCLDSSLLQLLFFKGIGAYVNIDFYNLTARVPFLQMGNCHRADLTSTASR